MARTLTLAAWIAALAVSLFAAPAVAGTPPSFVWSGGGSTSATGWSNAENWVGGVGPTASSSADVLTFPALGGPSCTGNPAMAACTNSTNNLSGISANAMQVSGRGYSLTGQGVTLGGGGLEVAIPGAASQNSMTLSMPLTLAADQSWSLSGPSGAGVTAGTLVHMGSVNGAHALDVTLANATTVVLQGDSQVGPLSIVGANSGTYADANGGVDIFGTHLNDNGTSNPIHLDHAFLQATGSIGDLTSTSGSLRVGESSPPRDLHAASVNLDGSSGTTYFLSSTGGVAGQDYGSLVSTGAIHLNGGLSIVNFANGCALPPEGQVVTLVSTTGTLDGTFIGVADGGQVTLLPSGSCPASGVKFRINYNTTGATKTVTATVLASGPSITINTPTANAHYAQNASVASDFSCSDAGHGVATCNGPATLNTTFAGQHQFTVSATDNDGNHSSKSVTYFVDGTPTTYGLSASAGATVSGTQAGQLAWHFVQHLGSNPAGAQPPSVQSLTTRLPEAFASHSANYPACAQVAIDGQAELPPECRDAIVGSGTATIYVGSPGQPLSNSIEEDVNLTLLNRAPSGTGLLMVINSLPEAPITITNRVYPGSFTSGPQPYGTGIQFNVPQDLQSQLGLTLSLTDVDATIGGGARSVVDNGTPTSYSYLGLSDCAAGLPFEASVVISANPASTTLTDAGTVDCVSGGPFTDYPANTSPPAVNGTPVVGQELTCDHGAWQAPEPTYTYRWTRDGDAIAGETNSTYTVQEADDGADIGCVVEGSNSAGQTTAASSTVHVGAAPVDSTPPQITITTPTEGQHFTQGQSVSSSFSCSDGAGSGVASCTGPVTVNTSSVGTHQFTVNATDNATNQSSKTVNYTVDAPVGGGDGGPGEAGGAGSTGGDPSAGAPVTADPGSGLGPAVTTITPQTRGLTPSAGDPLVTTSQVLEVLSSQLTPPKKLAKIAAILASGGVTETFSAPSAGTLLVRWFFLPPGAKVSKAKPVLVASGSKTYTAAGKSAVKLKLTPAGKQLLKKSKRLQLAAKGTFTPKGGKATSAVKKFAVRK